MEAGTVMGFIGRNGAGKTTTLKALLRLVHPDAGKVTLLGLDAAHDEHAIRQKIGFVSGGLSYYPRKTLAQITAVTRRFYPAWDEALYRRCLARFRLSEEKRTSALSEGMKVKYQLALAMSHGAELLILDEPTSGLDPVSRDDLLDLFLTLREEDGVSSSFQRTSPPIWRRAPIRSRTYKTGASLPPCQSGSSSRPTVWRSVRPRG